MNLKHEWQHIKQTIHTELIRLRMGEYDTPIVLSLGILVISTITSIIVILTKG